MEGAVQDLEAILGAQDQDEGSVWAPLVDMAECLGFGGHQQVQIEEWPHGL